MSKATPPPLQAGDGETEVDSETDYATSTSTSSTATSTPPSSVDSNDPPFLKSSTSQLPLNSDPWSRPSASGRKEGRSFHHGRLISSLRRACLSAGPNLVVLEATVKDLVRCEHTDRVIGVSAGFKLGSDFTSEGESTSTSTVTPVSAQRNVYAPLTIIADGCFSKFRTLPGSRVPKPDTRSHFVGVILKNADMPMKYHGTVSLTPGGPVLMYQIGDVAEETRMLVDVKGKLPSVGDGSLKVSLGSD